MRKCTKHLEKQIGNKDALNVLPENQSLSSYKHMRLSQSFESPLAKRQRYANNPPKQKKHSPKYSTVTWDKNQLKNILTNWPIGETIKQHGISAKNGGQIVK